MLSKDEIVQNMLAVLTELQAYDKVYHPSDMQMRLYNGFLNQLEVYCEVLDDDVPDEYTELIEKYIIL